MKKYRILTIFLGMLSIHGIVMSACCAGTDVRTHQEMLLLSDTHEKIKQYLTNVMVCNSSFNLADQGKVQIVRHRIPTNVTQDGRTQLDLIVFRKEFWNRIDPDKPKHSYMEIGAYNVVITAFR